MHTEEHLKQVIEEKLALKSEYDQLMTNFEKAREENKRLKGVIDMAALQLAALKAAMTLATNAINTTQNILLPSASPAANLTAPPKEMDLRPGIDKEEALEMIGNAVENRRKGNRVGLEEPKPVKE